MVMLYNWMANRTRAHEQQGCVRTGKRRWLAMGVFERPTDTETRTYEQHRKCELYAAEVLLVLAGLQYW